MYKNGGNFPTGIKLHRQQKDTLQKVSFQMVGAAGFEPTTSRSRTVRATICATPR